MLKGFEANLLNEICDRTMKVNLLYEDGNELRRSFVSASFQHDQEKIEQRVLNVRQALEAL
jgi:hypothetical protein